jgi:hypothetical protein
VEIGLDWMASSGTMLIPSFTKICQYIQTLLTYVCYISSRNTTRTQSYMKTYIYVV